MRSRLRTIGTPASTSAASLLAQMAFSLTPGGFWNASPRSIDSHPADELLPALLDSALALLFPFPVSWRRSSALIPRLRSRRRAETASFALTVTVRGWPVAEV